MTFGSLAYGPRAQSVLHCHGVLALRQGPWTPAWTEAVQNESQLQEDTDFFTLPQAASSDVRNRKRMKESLTLGTGVLEALQNRIVAFHESLLCWGIWRSIEIEGPPQKKQICLS